MQRLLVAIGVVAVAAGALPARATSTSFPLAGAWQGTATLMVPRAEHTATLLADGQVLVTRGFGCAPICASAERYDAQQAVWHLTGGMSTGRADHTATLLPDGRVLVAGGYGCASTYVCASAELYDPNEGTWRPPGSMSTGRAGHTATLLPDGQVLVVGGYGCEGHSCGHLATAELYNPATGTWHAAGSLMGPREYHTATLLPDGVVLVTGGSARCATLGGCLDEATASLFLSNQGILQSSGNGRDLPGRIAQSGRFRCAMTPIHLDRIPGVAGPATVPWVQAHPASSGISGRLFFGDRLPHTNGWMPDGGTTKTLWQLTDGQTNLTITARNLAAGPTGRALPRVERYPQPAHAWLLADRS